MNKEWKSVWIVSDRIVEIDFSLCFSLFLLSLHDSMDISHIEDAFHFKRSRFEHTTNETTSE